MDASSLKEMDHDAWCRHIHWKDSIPVGEYPFSEPVCVASGLRRWWQNGRVDSRRSEENDCNAGHRSGRVFDSVRCVQAAAACHNEIRIKLRFRDRASFLKCRPWNVSSYAIEGNSVRRHPAAIRVRYGIGSNAVITGSTPCVRPGRARNIHRCGREYRFRSG